MEEADIATGVVDACQFGKVAFNRMPGTAIVQLVQVSSLGQLGSPAFPPHPASPSAAETLRLQQQNQSQRPAFAGVAKLGEERSLKVPARADRTGQQQPQLSTNSTPSTEPAPTLVLAALPLSGVCVSEESPPPPTTLIFTPAEAASSSMVKSLLRTREKQIDGGSPTSNSQITPTPNSSDIVPSSNSSLGKMEAPLTEASDVASAMQPGRDSAEVEVDPGQVGFVNIHPQQPPDQQHSSAGPIITATQLTGAAQSALLMGSARPTSLLGNGSLRPEPETAAGKDTAACVRNGSPALSTTPTNGSTATGNGSAAQYAAAVCTASLSPSSSSAAAAAAAGAAAALSYLVQQQQEAGVSDGQGAAATTASPTCRLVSAPSSTGYALTATPSAESAAASSDGLASTPNDTNGDAISPAQMQIMKDFVANFKKRRTELGYTQSKVGASLVAVHGSVFSQTTVCRFENMKLSYANVLKLMPLLEQWLAEATPLNGGSARRRSTEAPAAVSLQAAVGGATSGSAGVTPTALAAAVASSGTASCAAASSDSPTKTPPAAMDCTAGSPPSTSALSPRRKRKDNRLDQRSTIPAAARDALEVLYKQQPKPPPQLMEDIAKQHGLAKSTVRIWFCNRRQRENRVHSIMYKGTPKRPSPLPPQ